MKDKVFPRRLMSKAKIMGILNVTPDSFYNKSCYPTLEQALKTAFLLEAQGADILDIGGESTRPGSSSVSEGEELERVIPLLEAIKGKIRIPISIDTVKPAVATAAVKAGVSMINDVTGFQNPEMVAIALKNDLDICVVHMQGIPQTMQFNPHYEKGITEHLLEWFQRKTEVLLKGGISADRIIIDPGIGFGKTVAHNLEIIQNLPKLKQLGFSMLLGISRKSFLSKILSKTTSELLSATLAFNAIAIASGVDIIRVHDVKEHRDVVDALDFLHN